MAKTTSSEMKQAQAAEARQRAAEADLQRVITERRIERFQNGYDAVESQSKGKRRDPKVERETEEGILTQRKQRKSINQARDLLRNFTAAGTIDHQKRVNVVGKGPTLKLNFENKENAKRWQNFFNKTFYKDCDGRDDTPFNEVLSCILSAIGTDGGQIVAFDDFLYDDGRLLFWSVDQLCEIDDNEWKPSNDRVKQWLEPADKNKKNKNKRMMSQDRGIIRDLRGRVHGYIVTSKPGRRKVPVDEATILPVGTAKLVKRPWRLNQIIPIPEYQTMAADMEDLYEMRLSELQTAKAQSKNYGYANSESKEEDVELEQGETPMSATEDSEVDSTEADTVEGRNYERAELFCGGHFDYVDPDDDITIYQPQRPNDKLPDFFDHCLHGAGASVGLANVHTKLQAKNNYTAFRGELLMSWQTFEVDQYFLETRVLNWLLPKLFDWKAKKEGWPLPEGWEDAVEWDWPEMQIIDPSKYYKAQQDALKVGSKDYSDIMGPDWEEKMDRLDEMVQKIRELGLPLSILETDSGASNPTEEQTQEQESETNEEEQTNSEDE